MKELTNKQNRFCSEYLIDLNATQAAIRAGYSRKTAKEIGYELLTKPHIQAYIEKRQIELQKKTGITIEWVINELKNNYEHCAKATPNLDRNGNETGIWRFDASNAIRCLELLGRHLGMFKERVELKPNKVNISSDDVSARFIEKLTKLAAKF